MTSAAQSGGVGGMAGGPETAGVEPSEIMLTAIAANTTIGLDWSRVRGATGYRLFFSNAAGVSPTNGQAIDVKEPAFVHRGLQNGMAYHYVVSAVLSGTVGPASMEASATPAGEWVLEQLGTGDFDRILDAGRVARVPIDKRIQVLLLAEGYMAAELATFHSDSTHTSRNNDVDRWIDEVLNKDPYSRFREAFVVWYLPRASAAHSGGDTAFDVTVSNGAIADVAAAAAPLWSALDAQGDDNFAFAAAAQQPVNLVAAFMIFDPQRGRAGLSGVTTSLRNPSVANQSIRAAFGLGHAHEFTHALASVGDEYMEASGRLPRMSETSNLSPTNRCDQLPWAHLLEGRGINNTASLIGAFGTAELGYHPELRCLMNGTHENGQFFCASGDASYTNLLLRGDNLCNFCRELTAYRIFERSGVLSGSDSFATWKAMYRTPFYGRFGFVVPPGPLPQTLECNRGQATPVYHACVP